MLISLIVACDQNFCIGGNNSILWKQKSDMKRFKEKTSNHCVIMGRKTFESLGKPLPNRLNIVITSDFNKMYMHDNVISFYSIEKAIQFCLDRNEPEIFVIGGGTIYKQFIDKNLYDKVYFSLIKTEINGGDTWFPKQYNKEYEIVDKQCFDADDNNEFDYEFSTLIFK